MQPFKKNILSVLLLIAIPLFAVNPPKSGTIKVGTDNNGQDIFMGYSIKGDIYNNSNKPIVICGDPYCGIVSWQRVQNELDYASIAYDPLGYGTSSKNSPTALDGINGLPGYSYRQQAYFLHQLITALAPQGPIVFVAVDVQGQVGIWYTKDYASTPYPFTKLFFENVNVTPTVADDNNPCTLAFVPYSVMQGIVNYYSADPQAAITAILGSSFQTHDCPDLAQEILNLCLPFATSIPADVFARIALDTYREDLTPLMSDPVFAKVQVANIYGTEPDYQNALPQTRRGVFSSFIGNAPGYPNPSFQGACTLPLPAYVTGFPISYVYTYPGHGTIVHLTAKRFINDLEDFIAGTIAPCSNRLPN